MKRRWIFDCLALSALLIAAPTSSADEAVRKEQAVAFTLEGQRLVLPDLKLEGGRVQKSVEPAQWLALDELDHIALDNAAELKLQWIGQDNHDLAQVGAAPGGNGIQDLHIRLTGLPFRTKIVQILAFARWPGQVRVWRLDTTNTPHWRIHMERDGADPTAELYFEPHAQDAFEKTFNFVITFDDGETKKLTLNATSHTSDSLKMVGAGVENPKAAAPSEKRAMVHLHGQTLLHGDVIELTDAALRLKTPWANELKIPAMAVRAIELNPTGPAAARKQLQDQIAGAQGSDAAVVLSREGNTVLLQGRVEAITPEEMKFRYEEESRAITRGRVIGVVLASAPQQRPPSSTYQVIKLVTGEQLMGKWTGLEKDALLLETAWSGVVRVPRAQISEIGVRNGRVVSLSELQPSQAEETPYFARRMNYQKNRSLDGGPLKIKGNTYQKGLAVHSRAKLTYALDGGFVKFTTLLGFDDAAEGRGSVSCRILGDDRELFARKVYKGSDEPIPLDLNVSGVTQLALEVDFGEREDTGDRIIWADPKLVRASASSETKP